MKKSKIYFLVFLFISINVYSQDKIISYYDINWKETKRKNASFYREAFKDNDLWHVNDYYISGKLQMSGTYIDDSLKVKDGEFKFYFENGNVESEGKFVNNNYVGIWKWFFDNSNLRLTGEYNQDGKKNGYWKAWYVNGNVDYEGNYLENKKVGEFKWYYNNGKVSSTEFYEDMVRIIHWDVNGNKENEFIKEIESKEENTSDILNYYAIEQKPEFPGGEAGLLQFIAANTIYPLKAKKKSITGRVFVGFIIDKAGDVTDIKILRSIHPLLDQAALDVIRKLPKWTPGKDHNRPVKVSYQIPLKFSLN